MELLPGPENAGAPGAAQPRGLAAADGGPSGALSPGSPNDYQMSTSVVISACTSRYQAQTLPSIGTYPHTRRGPPSFMRIKEGTANTNEWTEGV